jgi:hypothetical protein
MKLYGLEWIPGAGAVGAVLLLLIVPSFALIGLVVIALAAVAALVALAGAVLALPYLLVRTVRRRLVTTYVGGPDIPAGLPISAAHRW